MVLDEDVQLSGNVKFFWRKSLPLISSFLLPFVGFLVFFGFFSSTSSQYLVLMLSLLSVCSEG